MSAACGAESDEADLVNAGCATVSAPNRTPSGEAAAPEWDRVPSSIGLPMDAAHDAFPRFP
jgi:hypothetical protein